MLPKYKMGEKIVNTGGMDCRGAGPGTRLPIRNDVSITKVLSENDVTKRVEVGCYHLDMTSGKCRVSTEVYCPHLHPVSS